MIQITEKALNKVQQIRKENQYDSSWFIRVEVLSGGCSGLTYNMKFDNQPKDSDEEFEDKGMKIVIDKKSMLYLFGTKLDFSDGLNGNGFHFVNPNASRTCSCGESFSL